MNVLWMHLDDCNLYLPGFLLAHPHAYMPNLARLKARGTTFTNAHAGIPLCEPSRPETWFGIRGVKTGQIHSFPADMRDRSYLAQAISIHEHLDDLGYQVRLSGKVYHENDDTWAGVGNETYALARYGWATNYGPYVMAESVSTFPDAMVTPNPWYPSAMDVNKGFGAGRLSEIKAHGYEAYYGTHGYYGKDNVKRGIFRYNSATDRARMPDELSTDWAIEWLAGGTPTAYTKDSTAAAKQPPVRVAGQPWFITLGYTGPHVPLWTPDEYFDAILDHFGIAERDIALPPRHGGDESLLDAASNTGDLADIPSRLQWPGSGTGRTNYATIVAASNGWPGGVTDAMRRQIFAYLARLYMVDVQLGRLLDALEASGEIDDTIVVLASDNGFAFSEKRWDFKQMVWRTGTGVPMIIAAPGYTGGQVCDHPVGLVDLYPTILDLLGEAAPAHPGVTPALSGTSLEPFLTDPDTTSWTGPPVALSVVKTGQQTNAELGADDVDPNEMALSVRARYWTYTASYWSGGTVQEELYCTARDPNEWENVASVTRYAEVKEWCDYWLCTLSTTAGGLTRTRAYSYTPSTFHPDDLARPASPVRLAQSLP